LALHPAMRVTQASNVHLFIGMVSNVRHL